MLFRVSVLIAVLALAACTAEPPAQPVNQGPGDGTPVSPYATPGSTTTAGTLQSREPDTCHAIDYVSVLGQPVSQISTLGITRPYRIVEWRGVEDQIYNPQRVVFRLDAAGNIYNIDCG